MILPHNPEIVDDISSQDWLDGMRHHRNRLLAESDWTQTADAPVDKAVWATYRQALRDFPATWEPCAEADFPNPPDYMEPEVSAPVDEAQPSTDAG